ncbi:TPA: hypothetical protein TXJ06_002136 [Streptococcus suis]|nr:hypothetical protein [Streptococcus suis]
MDEERVVSQIARISFVSGEVCLKSLFLTIGKLAEQSHYSGRVSPVLAGQTNWDSFLASPGSKELKEFLTNEVNLSALKSELAKYGIGFAFRSHSDGTTSLAYDFRNRAIVEKALSNFLVGIQKNPQEFMKRTLKTPKNMNPKEKIAYYSKQMKQQQSLAKKVALAPQIDKGKAGLTK